MPGLRHHLPSVRPHPPSVRPHPPSVRPTPPGFGRALAVWLGLLQAACAFDPFGVPGAGHAPGYDDAGGSLVYSDLRAQTDDSGSSSDDTRLAGGDGAPSAAADAGHVRDTAPALPADAAPPAVDQGPLCAIWNAAHFDSCALPQSAGTLTMSASGTYLYDTDSGLLRRPDGSVLDPTSTVIKQPLGPPARVLVSDAFVLGAASTLRVRGSRPLIIASWSSLVVAGTLDLSSRSPGTVGAGSNASACAKPTTGGIDSGRGGGGGGGAFGGGGGAGGTADYGNVFGGASSGAAPIPYIVRGGCTGANGGGKDGGRPGRGGGAVQLTARLTLSISGTINASGGGGEGGERADGGAGGGSGGLIGFDAPEIKFGPTAIVAANGGAGGEGASGRSDGAPGEDGRPGTQVAAGGAHGAGDGGDGGNGGHLGAVHGSAGQAGDDGGGGGGGSAGYVLIWGSYQDKGATFSPAPDLP